MDSDRRPDPGLSPISAWTAPADLHDTYRVSRGRMPTYHLVMRGQYRRRAWMWTDSNPSTGSTLTPTTASRVI
jgi:hypothetical protein